jgi:hypothetical protein
MRRALDHNRLDARPLERDRRRETADSRSDDNRAHASSLRRRWRREALLGFAAGGKRARAAGC